MPSITVSQYAHGRFTDIARARGMSDEEALLWLIDVWKEATSTTTGPADGDQVPVHVVYLGERVEGIYHPSTGLIDIVSGPAPKVTGLKPSPAAGEVIRAINEARGKEVTGGRNGWGFWVVTATGELLQSIRTKARRVTP